MLRFLAATTLVSLISTAAGAEVLPSWPARLLVIQADEVVLASPADPRTPGHFRVHRTFKGERLRPGDMIEVDVSLYIRPDDEAAHSQPVQALLFLRKRDPGQAGKGRSLVLSGLRLLTGDGRVWRPVQMQNPGPYQMTAEREVSWEALRARVEADAAEVADLLERKKLPRGKRTQAILGWVERHRHQLGPASSLVARFVEKPFDDLASHGWYELEHLPFQWILATESPPDCWQAVRLYAELHGGKCLGLESAAFASEAGRAFLLQQARGEGQLDGDRLRALQLLGSRVTLNPGAAPRETPGVSPASVRERRQLVEALLPPLAGHRAAWRRATADCLRELCRPGDLGEAHDRALAALVKAYQAEPPSSTRDALAEAVRVTGGEEHWKQLGGRAGGLAAYLQELGVREHTLYFWLVLRPEGVRVRTPPTLVLEKLNLVGWVSEKKTMPLPATAAPDWKEGWDSAGPLHVEVDVGDLQAGAWRISVSGVTEGGVSWVSEPRTFRAVHRKLPALPGKSGERKQVDIILLNEDGGR